MLSNTLKAMSKSMKQLRPPHAMCPSGLVSNQYETGAQNISQYTFSPFPCHYLESHVMCSGDLVLKPQGEPGTKPAHNAHFLHPWVIGWELMSGALAAWCRKHQVNPGQNQLTMHIFCIPGRWLGAHVMCSGGRVETTR